MKLTKQTASLSLATLVVTSLLTPHLGAQMGQKSRSVVHRLGNSLVGIDAVAWARSQCYSNLPRVDTVLRTPIHFLGFHGEMSRLAVTAARTSSLGFAGSYSLKIMGTTRKVGSVTGSGSRRFNFSANVFPSAPSYTFWVGFFPLTVSGNIGYAASMDTNFINFRSSSRGVAISGNTQSYGTGYAEAGIGVPGLQAGVNTTLRLGQQKFEGYLAAFTNYLSTRYHRYSLTPVRVFLKLFGELGWMRGEVTVVDESLSQRNYAPFLR